MKRKTQTSDLSWKHSIKRNKHQGQFTYFNWLINNLQINLLLFWNVSKFTFISSRICEQDFHHSDTMFDLNVKINIKRDKVKGNQKPPSVPRN